MIFGGPAWSFPANRTEADLVYRVNYANLIIDFEQERRKLQVICLCAFAVFSAYAMLSQESRVRGVCACLGLFSAYVLYLSVMQNGFVVEGLFKQALNEIALSTDVEPNRDKWMIAVRNGAGEEVLRRVDFNYGSHKFEYRGLIH